MIDVHTHILPDIDDGASGLLDAETLLRLESEQGVHEIVFTPHYYGKRTVGQFLYLRMQALEKIRSFIPSEVKIRQGAEVFLKGINDPADDALCALAIEGTKCVLVELPYFGRWPNSLLARLNDFIAETGYTPIIAHVERYEETLQNPATVSELIEMGCLIQVNTCSFLMRETKRFALALLKNGMVHCLGTDAHSSITRVPDYAQAKQAVEQAGLLDRWEQVQTTMRGLFAGNLPDRSHTKIRRIGKRYF